MNRSEAPAGLVGVTPKDPIGVRISMGIKGKSGAPVMKGRIWFGSPTTHSEEFKRSGGGAYRGLARDLSPAFEAWNAAARALGDDISRTGAGRVGSLRGNFVHARLGEAARWNRAAQKAPNANESPKSLRPWCEGNGIEARRYAGVRDGEEVFDTIACPNEDCPYSMNGLCRPAVDLIFRLRWREDDPWERQFPALLAHWHTTSWRSLRSLLGLLELVLGTEAVAPWEPKEKWRAGLAAEMGISNPSLVGLPFIMAVGEQTKPSEQQRFTVCNFSPDGNLVAWLLEQRRQRAELAGSLSVAALPPATVLDAEFQDVTRHEARAEWQAPEVEIPEVAISEAPAPEPAPSGPVLLGPERAASLRRQAEQMGVDPAVLSAASERMCGTGSIENAPASLHGDLLRALEEAQRAMSGQPKNRRK